MKNNIGLKEDYTHKMGEKLNIYLSDVQIVYMNVRGYHWNIKGKQFFALHEKFEEVYNALNLMADEVAERILMLGEKPMHAYSDYLKAASIKEKVNISSAEDTISALLDDFQHLMSDERGILAMAAENHDEGTVGMVSAYISEQEKLIWMFKSLLK